MKQRIEVARALKFSTADEVRKRLQEDNPGKEYQVRKTKNGFKVVERVDLDGAD